MSLQYKAKPGVGRRAARVAEASVRRMKARLREIFREARGRNVETVVEELGPVLRGWVNYFRLVESKGVFEELDGWIRRRLRCILWRQWKRPWTRAKNLIKRGLTEKRAWRSAMNGRGTWWNSGAPHMNHAFPKSYFDSVGLVSLLDHLRCIQYAS